MKQRADRAAGRYQVRRSPGRRSASTCRYLDERGVSQNVASFVGATTLREHVIGLEDTQADARASSTRCARSCAQEMEAGALGIGSSLIYAPAFYADTDELIELCKVAAEYRGKYISHMRSEGDRLLEAVDELIRDQPRGRASRPRSTTSRPRARRTGRRWTRPSRRSRRARKAGLKITADMYTYTGGRDRPRRRPCRRGSTMAATTRPTSACAIRRRATQDRAGDARHRRDDWENLYLAAGSPDRVLLVEFKTEQAEAADRQDARRGGEAARRGPESTRS